MSATLKEIALRSAGTSCRGSAQELALALLRNSLEIPAATILPVYRLFYYLGRIGVVARFLAL